MARINDHYLKLAGGYLFPEIARRVSAFETAHPDLAPEVIRCGIGDVTEPLPPAVVEAMHRAVDELAVAETFRGYGPPTGYEFLREAIAEGDFRSRGIEIDIEEILISDGSKSDAGAIVDVFAGEGINRIAVTDPVYPVYVDTNVMAGNTGRSLDGGGYEGLVLLPCTEANGFVPEPPDEDVDLVYLCFPNNPTGGMIDRAGLETWVRWARERGAIILYDVAYADFISDPDLPRSIFEIEGARECAIEFHSFSKNGGFTGVRCGYTVCPKELVGRSAGGESVRVLDLWTRRWATKSNGVSYPVQRAAEALYHEPGRTQSRALVEGYLANATRLREGCAALGLEVFGGEHAPYVWVRCPEGLTSWDVFDRMLEDLRVVVTPGSGFGPHGEGFFRISAFNTPANVATVVERMATASGLFGTTARA